MEAKTKKYLLWGLGAVAVGTGGYFLFKYLQDKNDSKQTDDFRDQVSEGTISVPASSQSSYSPSPRPSQPAKVYNQFPLKYGSKGTLVRDIQIALNKKYGASIDVDGDWKGQTENALVAKDLPTVIDNQTYAKIITGSYGKGSKTTPPPDDKKTDDKKKPSAKSVAKSISKQLHSAIKKDDVFSAVNALKKIKNKEGYKLVNDEFKKTKLTEWNAITIVSSVSKTVVNALLDQFTSAEYKKKINEQLYRIGLKYDGTKWSLSGLLAGTNQLITVLPAVVWDAKGKRMNVPRSTIIGTFIRAKNGITEFETLDGRILYTNTVTIRYAA